MRSNLHTHHRPWPTHNRADATSSLRYNPVWLWEECMKKWMWLGLLALFACDSDKGIEEEDTTSTPDEEPDTDTDTDTGTGTNSSEGLVPTWFTIYANLSIDVGNGTLNHYYVDGKPIEPWVGIRMGEDDSDTECWLYFVFEDPTAVLLEDWSWDDATDGIDPTGMEHTGIFVPDETPVYLSEGCNDWNAEPYGELSDVVIPLAWGVGMGTLRSDIQGTVEEDSDTLETWYDHLQNGELLGGSWSSTLWDPNLWASHMALGAPLDEKWSLEVDESGDPLDYYGDADYISGLPSGLYLIRPIYTWDFDSFFGHLRD